MVKEYFVMKLAIGAMLLALVALILIIRCAIENIQIRIRMKRWRKMHDENNTYQRKE
ncbi:hypothetical protein SAMN02746066_04541 [Anaerosporobacter mobilis DSM 15930]|uniref:Uncharacterized protein n=1 Tax=Anaerosporobacter mobilis DSM 15930 TaxID=1120996 RepID=A0A1M7NJC0_9FIRM|nr:hypothetical protein [Anaerosporobacter mobilis]SHN03776.1 hypothetical protein SAMN02746066_04541 [Anaerosporobacter mobilis DSM 15930]